MINVKFPTLMDSEAFITAVNHARLKNKNQWVIGSVIVEGMWVQYKAYNTWIQIYRADGIDYAGGMEAKVSEYKDTLNQPFKDQENAS